VWLGVPGEAARPLRQDGPRRDDEPRPGHDPPEDPHDVLIAQPTVKQDGRRVGAGAIRHGVTVGETGFEELGAGLDELGRGVRLHKVSVGWFGEFLHQRGRDLLV